MYPITIIMHTACNISTQRLTNKLKVLEYYREDIHVITITILTNVDAVEEDLAFLWIVQTAQQLNKGSLAAAVFANNSKPLTDLELHADIFQCVSFSAGILEGDILELYLILPICPLLCGVTSLVHSIGDI